VRKVTAFLAVAALLAACSSSSPTPTSGGGGGGGTGNVDATVHEWQIDLSSSTVPAGEVTFTIQNTGEETHEFVIVQTDEAADSLPVVDDQVDESAFTPVDEKEDIEPGTTDLELTVDLEAGHYVILCNLLAHYGKGMHVDLNVE
jgi:uncharacterized cupredoxin-like copper-binding protein